MRDKTADVPLMSRFQGNGAPELIDAAELGARWRVPESWIRNRTRSRTPISERIPCVRLGRYVRFEWGSVPLSEWLAKKRAWGMGTKKPNPHAQALGRLSAEARAKSNTSAEIASMGGKARAKKLSAAERSRIAKLAVAARERKRKEKS